MSLDMFPDPVIRLLIEALDAARLERMQTHFALSG